MDYIRINAQADLIKDVGFIMPCHSTPFYSHVHKKIPMWFLSCEPPKTSSNIDSHYFEAQDFNDNPEDFIIKNLVPLNSKLVTRKKSIDSDTLIEFYIPVLKQKIDRLSYSVEDINLAELYKNSKKLRFAPSHLILYDSMKPRIEKILNKYGYTECARFFNTIWESDERRKGDVLVFCYEQ
ncbi:hypothetical protein BB558_000182 [Smittium angustum]|nr:hypothetical protein BB558_000182 [Smittium angustum]